MAPIKSERRAYLLIKWIHKYECTMQNSVHLAQRSSMSFYKGLQIRVGYTRIRIRSPRKNRIQPSRKKSIPDPT